MQAVGFIVDIDGTIAKPAVELFSSPICNKPKEYICMQALANSGCNERGYCPHKNYSKKEPLRVDHHSPILAAKRALISLFNAGYQIWYYTGRYRTHELITKQWVKEHRFPPFYGFYFRRDEDYRPHVDLKKDQITRITKRTGNDILIVDDLSIGFDNHVYPEKLWQTVLDGTLSALIAETASISELAAAINSVSVNYENDSRFISDPFPKLSPEKRRSLFNIQHSQRSSSRSSKRSSPQR